MAGTLDAIDFDPGRANASPDPYPLYRRLRDREPVHRCASRDLWVLSRFEDVEAVLADGERFTSTRADRADGVVPVAEILFSDAPAHDRLRAVIRERFRAPAVAGLEERVRRTATELLAGLGGAERADLAVDLTWPLALATVGDLIGVPPAARPSLLQALQRRTYPDDLTEPERRPDEAAAAAEGELLAFFRDALGARAQLPTDDLLGDLAREAHAGRLPLEDAVGLADFLFEGLDTAANLLASCLVAVMMARPRPSLASLSSLELRTAVEELIRYDSPIQGMWRRATRDVEVPGGAIPSGAVVWLLFGSANRDERRVADPDRLLLDRPPRRTLAFGTGTHVCPGAPLARLLARVALPAASAWAEAYEVRCVRRPRNDFTRAILSLEVERA